MPHHWWLIEGDNPGPKQRAAAVKKAVDDLPHVECQFVGREAGSNDWYALVRVDPGAPAKELGTAKKGIKVRRSLRSSRRSTTSGGIQHAPPLVADRSGQSRAQAAGEGRPQGGP